MNKANKHFKRGLLIFVLLIISILASLYFEQGGFTILFFYCAIFSIVLSLCMLLVLLQTRKEVEKLEEEVFRIREREKAHIDKNKQKKDDDNRDYTEFRVDESLARIIPAEGMHFDNVNAYCENILQKIAKELDIVQALVFVLNDVEQIFNVSGEYAYFSEERPRSFPLGETISGQVAKNKKILNLKELPAGYVTVLSGLGKSAPSHLVIAPIVYNDNSVGVIELASFKPFDENHEMLVERICELMVNKLNELRS